MIKLSQRLQLIFDMIEEGETMADIGTDHGFLPMALWESGKCRQVILSDVNSGPLEKARENMGKAGIPMDMDMRMGDGLDTIQPGEVTTIVIAGMGGVLMTEILGGDLNKTHTFRKIILQPRNGQDKLRFWLVNHGFRIEKERLVMEKGKICEILLVTPDQSQVQADLPPRENNYYRIPDPKKVPDRELMIRLLHKMIRKEEKIIHNINLSGRDPKNEQLRKEAVLRKEYFIDVLRQEDDEYGSNPGNAGREH